MSVSRRSTLGAALCVLALAASSPLAAQAADAGTFRILLDGRETGTEEFTIRQTGSGATSQVVATGEVRLPGGSVVLASRLSGRGLEAAPVDYRVDVRGDSPRRILGTVGSGRFSARVGTPSGEQFSEFLASNGAVILDEGLAHHYYFLAQRLRSGQVPVIIPRENRQVMATVTDRGQERVTVGDATATLYHLVVHPAGGDERHVWVDALNRVIRVEVPARGYRAERTALPR